MTEPTITCPHCKTQIKLTESLAAPLIESTRKQFEQQLAQKDSDIVQREQAMRDKEKQLVDAKNKLDEQVADQVAEQLKKDRTRIAAEEAKKAKQAATADLEQKAQELAELQEVLQQRNEKLAEAQKVQADLIKKERALDDEKRELELTVEKRIQDGLTEVRTHAKKEAEDEQKLKVMEKERTIAAMQKQIEELKRRAEQGSQQLQGEVLELELENLLRSKFPFDAIEPVPKGEFGGDVLHRVVGMGGQPSGTILWESKRTKNWSDGWLTKLREDQRTAKAEIAVIVSQTLPKGVETFEIVDGVLGHTPTCRTPGCYAFAPIIAGTRPCVAVFRRPAKQNGNGLPVPHRPAFSPARGSHRRSLFHHAGRPRQGTQGDHEAVGQARRADRARNGRNGGDVWRLAGDCGEVASGNRRFGAEGIRVEHLVA